MAYTYLKDASTRKELNEYCLKQLHKIQRELSDYFTFDIRLIGSGSVKLITVNGKNNNIDLDYNLIIQRDYYGYLSNPKKVKQLFIDAFNKNFEGVRKVSNNTSVITTHCGNIGEYIFSADFAIMIEGNDNYYYKLVFDKRTQNYIWNKVKDSSEFQYKITMLKKRGYWQEIKDSYIEKKNYYIGNKNYTSSMILMETVNDLYQRYIG